MMIVPFYNIIYPYSTRTNINTHTTYYLAFDNNFFLQINRVQLLKQKQA